MTAKDIPSAIQDALRSDRESHKVQVGIDSNGEPIYVRVSDDGYMLSKLMAYDVDVSGADVQVIADEEGRLRIQLDDVEFTGDLEVDTDDLEANIEDQLLNYHMSDWLESGDNTYVGYLTKAGAWMIKKFTESTGQVRYVSGSSGYSFADPASLSYDDFATEF